MKKIIFIHGMFQNAKSWDGWDSCFTKKGYICIAESWPLHEGEPAQLRSNIPAGLGDLRLEEVIRHFEGIVRTHGTDSILIGHSVGGLIVQRLVNEGLGSNGVCLSSVAPNKMLSFDWGFFRNSISITNPFKGDEPFIMTPEGFHKNFCNTMSREASDKAYARTATHDSRNILRDCLLKPGEIDLDKTSAPLLFIGGENDEIIPAELSEKNAKAYKQTTAQIKIFPGRGHFICGQPGWEEVAEYVSKWILESGLLQAAATQPLSA